MSFTPLYIRAYETGLVESRQNFILPDDAYPKLENAYVWRERIKRKQGYELLGRLRRTFDDLSLGNSGASPWSFNIYSTVTPAITPEPNAQIELGSVVITINPTTTTGNILNYTNDVNCLVTTTAPHGLSTGNSISISGVVIVDGTGNNEINGGPYVISVVTASSFTINRNSIAWGVYASGGTWTLITSAQKLIDQGNGTLATNPVSGITGTINYFTGAVTITGATAAVPALIDFNYFPGLPVMGIRQRDLQNATYTQTVFFDTKYAYIYDGGFQEFLPGTTWTGTDSEFFWTTNYWEGDGNYKIFWATNFSSSGDPIRYCNGNDGTTWVDFTPIINVAGDLLLQALCILPFRGRMLAFNTVEGAALPAKNYFNRIRWAAIGNPFTITDPTNTPPIVTVSTPAQADAWRDDIRGKGGFLDIPTNENIVSVGFVRDNLVIYCERSTWQLRYTGRTIAPFQIEKVNSELGSSSTFSAVQFDTSLVGVGDKGIVECDSFKSERIDIKIPDFVFNLQNANNGQKRIHGVRDFINRLAYWTYCSSEADGTYPDQRLCYNYENDSWSTFTDSLTTLGTFQELQSRTWLNTPIPWIQCNFPWINRPLQNPVIVGGNQQGFVEQLDQLTTNEPSLSISAITSHGLQPTVITSVNHNLKTGQIIKITGIPASTPFATALNNGVFFVIVLTSATFSIFTYNATTEQFSDPQQSIETGYVGGGLISVRDNFNITSKKFNQVEQAQSIMLGYMDILMSSTEKNNPGEIAMNVYIDYNDQSSTNTLPENTIANGSVNPQPDTFFNSIIPTTSADLSDKGGTKFWQRVYCPTRGNFITIQFLFNNAQMAGQEQELEVQIDAQVLWTRAAGNLTQL